VTKFGRWKAPEFAGGSSETLGHFNPTFELKTSSSELWIQLEQVPAPSPPQSLLVRLFAGLFFFSAS